MGTERDERRGEGKGLAIPPPSLPVLFLDYKQSLIFLRDSKGSESCKYTQKLLPARSVPFPRERQFSRALAWFRMTLLSLRKIKECLWSILYDFPLPSTFPALA